MFFFKAFYKIIKQFAYFYCAILVTALTIFCLLNLLPGNVAQVQIGLSASEEQVNQLLAFWKLDEPFLTRLYSYITHFIKLDLGTSYVTNLRVSHEIFLALPNTFILTILALCIAIVVGILLPCIIIYFNYKILQYVFSTLITILITLPSFVIGIVLIQIFIIEIPLFSLFKNLDFESFILPSLTLGLISGSFMYRTTYFSIKRSCDQFYIRMLKHNGLSKNIILRKYLFKEALNPLLTLTSIELTGLIAGAFVTETLFGIPGMGQLLTQAMRQKDTPTIMGGVIILSSATYIIQKIMEAIYKKINPQLKQEKTRVSS